MQDLTFHDLEYKQITSLYALRKKRSAISESYKASTFIALQKELTRKAELVSRLEDTYCQIKSTGDYKRLKQVEDSISKAKSLLCLCRHNLEDFKQFCS